MSSQIIQYSYSSLICTEIFLVGIDHAHTIKSQLNLGKLYRNQGKLDMAEIQFYKILKSSEKTHGSTSLETVRLVSTIAILLKMQGKLDKAEDMYDVALSGFMKISGKNNIDTLCTLNNMGILYKEQKEYKKSRIAYDKALLGRQQLLGTSFLVFDQTNTQTGESVFPASYYLRVMPISFIFLYLEIQLKFY